MALLGSSIDPRLMVQDYSGYARAGEIQGQMYAQIGKDVGGLVETYGDYKKQQGDDERLVQKSKSVAKAIGDLIPDLQPALAQSMGILDDKEIPLSQRKAQAEAIGDILNLGISEVRNSQNLSLKERELGIQESSRKAAQFEANRGKRVAQERTGILPNGEQYTYRVYVDPQNPQDAVYEDGTNVYGQTPTNTGEPPMPNWPDAITPSDSPPQDGGLFPTGGANPEAIAAAAELTGGQTDVSNGSPMPPGTPTITQMPKVDGPPLDQLPPGAVPSKVENIPVTLTPAQVSELGAMGVYVQGSLNKDGTFGVTDFGSKPLPVGTTIKTDGKGGVEIIHASGAGSDKGERAAKERVKQQQGFVSEFTSTAVETIKMIPNLPDNPFWAKGASFWGELFPGTETGRVGSRLGTLKANLALDKINQMRAASPTGGAAGNMTVQEWPLFMQEFGSFDAAENKQDLEARLKNASVKLFDRVNGTPEERAEAIKIGVITVAQNEIVDAQYNQLLSDLGITTTKTPTPVIGISPDARRVLDTLLPK